MITNFVSCLSCHQTDDPPCSLPQFQKQLFHHRYTDSQVTYRSNQEELSKGRPATPAILVALKKNGAATQAAKCAVLHTMEDMLLLLEKLEYEQSIVHAIKLLKNPGEYVLLPHIP